MEADFSGWATRSGRRCSDGRTIQPDAFQHQDGVRVPLVWQHMHGDPTNVLGHAILEKRDGDIYAHGFFNDSEAGKNAKIMVQHGDITSLSIYANELQERQKNVYHGSIREVSLVLSGANPGALIENVNLQHGDTIESLDDEAIIYTGDTLAHEEGDNQMADDNDSNNDESGSGKTIKDVVDGMSDEQRKVLDYLVGAALDKDDDSDEDDSDDSDDDGDDDAEHSNTQSNTLTHNQEAGMSRNVFQSNAGESGTTEKPTLSHGQLQAIVTDAKRCGSFKEAFLAHAQEYGIENIDLMFPDAHKLQNYPDFVSRRMEWVSGVISGTSKSPFSRIKSLSADITQEDARAKGYIKGRLKKEEFFALSKRVTTPTTVYKKQKLDRDDIIDITDLDVVAWLKAEMRVMLDEALAESILFGDGREPEDEDKIRDPLGASEGAGIRSIANDSDFYAHQIEVASDVAPDDLTEAIIRSRVNYKGSGNPTLYTTESVITDLLLQKDAMGRRIYRSEAELASELRVSKVVAVEAMERETDLVGVIVNLSDYTVGADRGGSVSMFDDFDIDYNQYKYLIETRLSGALTKPKSAVVIKRVDDSGTVGV